MEVPLSYNRRLQSFAMEVPLSCNRSRRSFGQIFREASVRIPFSPLNLQQHDSKDHREFESGDEEYFSLSKRRGADFWKKRQIFVHSYRFTVKKTVAERVKASLRKLRAVAWTIVACKYCRVSLPSGLKRFDCRCVGNQERRS